MTGPYDDMINLPHHVSAARAQMLIANRAAQFAPFAALSGYDTAIRETARLTEKRVELDEDMKADLDRKLRLLTDRIAEHPEVVVTYFRPDDLKEGGTYVTVAGEVKKIDNDGRAIVLMSGERIAAADVLVIECELLVSAKASDI